MRKFTRKIKKRLGELLIERGVITREELDKALAAQKQEGGLIGETIVELGFAKEEDIVYTLALQYGFPFLPLETYDISEDVLKIIPKQVAFQYCVVPINRMQNTLSLVMSNPLNQRAIEDIEYMTKCDIQIFVSSSSSIRSVLDKFYK
jgi:type IV pilus assembly protein PilB